MIYRLFPSHFLSLLGVVVASMFLSACEKNSDEEPEPFLPKGFEEREAETISFPHAEFLYWGDDIGERFSDGWVVKLYTEMEIDDAGNPIVPGCVMQLLLNAYYHSGQVADPAWLEGIYRSQSNSGDFNPLTFVSGYMDSIELPGGRVERPDATFYADLAEGSVEMEVDLLNEGVVQVVANEDGSHTIEGILVGERCLKRYFSWRGTIEADSYVEPETQNSTLVNDLILNNLTHGQLQDRGDIFGLGDESCRSFLLYLASDGVDLTQFNPTGTGDLLRLELLVPWTQSKEQGIPAGSYPMLVRNADTSLDRDQLTPFHAISGLPNRFTNPYWSGTWYVNWVDGSWGETYARIDQGTVTVQRTASGGYDIRCQLEDCSSPSRKVLAEVMLEENQLIIL